MKKILLFLVALLTGALLAEEQIIDGVKWVCKDGLCMPVEEPAATDTNTVADVQRQSGPVFVDGMRMVCEDGVCTLVPENGADGRPASSASAVPGGGTTRLAHGYMDVGEFIAFLENEKTPSFFEGKAWWLVVILILLGGLAMNLTPCVLPMIPINLMIIGRSASRGAFYGAGIATAYGVLGILAAFGGMAFGVIQGSPWFNAAIALLFLVLALSMLGVFFIDFSKRRNDFASMRESMWPWLFAFFMGVVSAVLAGACVAPILIAVLLLTADLFSKGVYLALALPFVMGVGMALPWPFAGAGLRVLPKPGAWMTKVNKIFGVLVLGFSAYYGYLAYTGFKPSCGCADAASGESAAIKISSPSEFSPDGLKRPVIVDCWASWCKNCTAMEKTTLADDRVKRVLAEKGFTFIKLQAEDIKELQSLPGFEEVRGLPAFVVFE